MSLPAAQISNTEDTVVARLLEHYAKAPDRLFCRLYVDEQATAISYRRLIDTALRYGAAYRQAGAAPGERVIVLFEHDPDMLYAFFGAMLAGLVPTFMPPLTPKQDPDHFWAAQAQVTERIGARLLVTSNTLKASIEANLMDARFQVLTPDSVGEEAIDPILPAKGDIAFLQHSSGTTSVKKGVVLTHEAVLAQVDAYGDAIHLTSDDFIASWLPLYHDMGFIACCILPALKRVPVVLLDAMSWVMRPADLLDMIERHRATLTWLPNFAFQHLASTLPADAHYDLTSLRAVINCSEPCRPETVANFLGRFSRMGVRPETVQACYAMAENTFAVTQTRFGMAPHTVRIKPSPFQHHNLAVTAQGGEPALSFFSCGTRVRGVGVQIVDDNREPLGERQIGEIAVTGACLADGYFEQADETKSRFDDDWYYTGDLGFMISGELYVTGRKDDLLILNGRNYYAHDLEHLLNDIEGVCPGRTIAIGAYDAALGSQALIILAETELNDDEARETLKKMIRQKLSHEINVTPQRIELLPRRWLIKSTSGKISRAATLERFYNELSTGKPGNGGL